MKSSHFCFILVMASLLCLPGCMFLKEYKEQASTREVPVLVTEYGQSGKTSAIGGVSYEMSFYNLSGKTIKYLYFYVTPYDIVGDVAPSALNNKAKAGLMLIGPIKPDAKTSFTWEDVWYNRTITCIEPDSIEIAYTDGSTEVLSGDDLQKALFHGLDNEDAPDPCRPDTR